MEARQIPTFSANLPSTANTDGPDAANIAAAFFGDPLEWQRLVLDGLLARNRRDKYAAKTYAISIPRQNGKSWIVRARCFYGMVFCGEKILFTCHHGDTSDEMFKAIAEVFEDEENEELHALLKAVRRTNGQQAIYLKNGGCIRFTTRTNGLARGKTYDVLIYDEAQELTVAQQAASLPAISAGRLKNPQTIYLGTPPGPENFGTVFANIHDEVHAGKSKTAWVEWSASEIGDKFDRARWYETNPSLGTLLIVDAVEAESDSMPPDSFARERLGWWSDRVEQLDFPIAKTEWSACATTMAAPDGVTVFAAKFSQDGGCCICAAVRPDEGSPHVEAVKVFSPSDGIAPVAAWLGARIDAAASAVIDGQGNAQTLQDRLSDDYDAPLAWVVRPRTADAVAAYFSFADAVSSRAVVHYENAMLDASATKCTRRRIGNSGWGFESAPDADACLIESAALAYWGAMTTNRDQRREMDIAW